MKNFGKFMFAIIAFNVCLTVISSPIISNVSLNPTGPVQLYDKLEITFSLNQYLNPYDSSIIYVYGEFWSPSGLYYKSNAFYYEGFTKSDYSCGNKPYLCESLTSNGIQNWKIRFTPNEIGSWKFIIKAVDVNGVTKFPALIKHKYFSCVESSNKGFITKANSKFLERTTGEFYFPVGENLCWYNNEPIFGNETYGTNEYAYYINKLSQNKSNYIRVWLDYYEGIALVGWDYTTNMNYYDLFNQKDAWQLDEIFKYADGKNVNIMLTLFVYGYMQNSWWDNQNPFNSDVGMGGPINTPYEFFSNQTAINKTKEIIRYIVARWGYATNLVAWELFNEYNQLPTQNSYQPPTSFYSDANSWHFKMYNYISNIDPFNHLITTSSIADWNNPNYSDQVLLFQEMDLTQRHDYKSISALEDFQYHFFYETNETHVEMNNPVMAEEWGYGIFEGSLNDPMGFNFHNTLWSTSFSTSFGSAAPWWWEFYIEPQNLYYMFQPVSDFMNSLETPSESFSSQFLEQNGLRSYFMSNNNIVDTIYGWVQDMNFTYPNLYNFHNNYLMNFDQQDKPSCSSAVNTLDIPVSNSFKTYKVEWYSAETASFCESAQVMSSANKIIKISIPTSLRTSKFGDAVFKVFLDCDNYIWRDGTLCSSVYNNVNSNIVCHKESGQVFFKPNSLTKIHSLWWNSNANMWNWSELNNAAVNVAGNLATSDDGSWVFYKTIDNRINAIYYDNNISEWVFSDLNSSATNVRGPLTYSNGAVFYVNSENRVNSIYKVDPTSNTWYHSDLNFASGNKVGSCIAAASNSQIFFTTLENKLKSIWYNSATSSWYFTDLNNVANSNVSNFSLTVTPNDQVFYISTDNKLRNIYYTSSGWAMSELNNCAVNVAGDLMSDDAGRVFYRTTTNNINCIYFSNNTWYRSELDNATNSNALPGNIATDHTGNVFYRGNDNMVHRLYYKSQCFNLTPNSFKVISLHNNESTPLEKDSSIIEIRIFPNPANNELLIMSSYNISKLIIFNTMGQILEVANTNNEGKYRIDVSSVLNGYYTVKIVLENGEVVNKRFVVFH